ncbi:SHOCT domain-containing protein [Streptomyces bikiniensis]|uniref:SHOCT domain-containing protein n=1 Tax=Streptomyces bikiniensis TaxID=1896 RepID=UPI0004BECAC1|nr:SHOCT domain-containing protein [Streptomyces bikiniensis]
MPGLLRGVARTAVISGTATAVSNRVSRRQAGRWAQQDEARASWPTHEQPHEQTREQPYAPPPPAAVPMDAKISQLHELGRLRDQGVLTGEEFEEQKRRILAS